MKCALLPGVLARKGHLSHAVPGKRRFCPGVFAVRLFMRPQQLAWQFLLILRRVKKSHSRPIEYVGATIGRPYTRNKAKMQFFDGPSCFSSKT